MHIQRISSIKNYRIFQNYTAPTTSMLWQPITVIYGPNGSGKSTLSSLFSDLATGNADGAGVSAEIFRRQNVVDTISEGDPDWSNLRVFNREYVRENLDFDLAEDGSGVSAKHLLTLGEKRIKAEKRLAEIKKRQEKIREEQSTHKTTLRAATKSRDAIPTALAQSISRELAQTSSRFNPRTYRAPKVRELLDLGDAALAKSASTDISQDETQIKSRVLPEVEWTSGKSEGEPVRWIV